LPILYGENKILVIFITATHYLILIGLIYVNYEYPNMALTCLNFVFTFIGLLICEKFGVFKIKKVSILKMLPMAASFCGFVVLTNYSLQYNFGFNSLQLQKNPNDVSSPNEFRIGLKYKY
jgi:hypothetical protein